MLIKNENFKKVLDEYRLLSEADAPPPPGGDQAAPPDAGGGPQPDAGGAPPPPDAGGGGLGGLGGLGGSGGLGGMGSDFGGGDPSGGGQQGGQSQTNDICTPKYVKLVSILVELYNAKLSNKKNLVLNLKIKVGEIDNLNDVHNADEVIHFMFDYLLKDDIKDAIAANMKSVKKSYKEIKSNKDEFKKYNVHKSVSSFLTDIATYSYLVSCMNALQETLPEINYGVDSQYQLDIKNAKAVFDEIRKNVDEQQKLLEIE